MRLGESFSILIVYIFFIFLLCGVRENLVGGEEPESIAQQVRTNSIQLQQLSTSLNGISQKVNEAITTAQSAQNGVNGINQQIQDLQNAIKEDEKKK